MKFLSLPLIIAAISVGQAALAQDTNPNTIDLNCPAVGTYTYGQTTSDGWRIWSGSGNQVTGYFVADIQPPTKSRNNTTEVTCQGTTGIASNNLRFNASKTLQGIYVCKPNGPGHFSKGYHCIKQ